MIISMTGYGTGASRDNDISVTVEGRTVNHRFLDIHIRLGRENAYLETEVQQMVRGLLGRGRVDLTINIQANQLRAAAVNLDVAQGYMEAAQDLKGKLGLQDSLDLKTLLRLPGVIKDSDDGASKEDESGRNLSRLVSRAVAQALESILRMRKQEGEALHADMVRHLASIADDIRHIQGLVPNLANEYRVKLEARVAQMLSPGVVDPQRLAQEVALLVDKSDISEELARLDSHLRQYSGLIESGSQIGKKLDFLLQEMQREINTILSKTGSLEATNRGIAIKAAIEKLREQVQNVE